MGGKKRQPRVVASRTYELRRRDGSMGTVTLSIDEPRFVEEGDWRCRIHLAGLPSLARRDDSYEQPGVDRIQAILGALAVIRVTLLSSAEYREGRLTKYGRPFLDLLVPPMDRLLEQHTLECVTVFDGSGYAYHGCVRCKAAWPPATAACPGCGLTPASLREAESSRE